LQTAYPAVFTTRKYVYGAQEELEKATGYRDEFGRLTDSE
jgi:hypothetical protein